MKTTLQGRGFPGAWHEAVHAQEKEVRIGVLGLFHTTKIVVSPVLGEPLQCNAGAEPWLVREPLLLALQGPKLRIDGADNALDGPIACDNGAGGATEFVASVPGKISRRYRGRLEIRPESHELRVVVIMAIETAVASIVAAESPPHAPLEALKAQAVATRSFLLAGKGRHRGFDFCDTTHCQFLRSPPGPLRRRSRLRPPRADWCCHTNKKSLPPCIAQAAAAGRIRSMNLGSPRAVIRILPSSAIIAGGILRNGSLRLRRLMRESWRQRKVHASIWRASWDGRLSPAIPTHRTLRTGPWCWKEWAWDMESGSASAVARTWRGMARRSSRSLSTTIRMPP